MTDDIMALADAYAYALGNSYVGSAPEARDALQAAVERLERRPLTDEQIDGIFNTYQDAPHFEFRYLVARSIEAAHGIKEAS